MAYNRERAEAIDKAVDVFEEEILPELPDDDEQSIKEFIAELVARYPGVGNVTFE